MKVGLIQGVRTAPSISASLSEVYQTFIEDAVRAEELGFDFVWCSEHHFTECQWTPSSILVLTAMATRTKRIRLGTQVLCMPFHNPLRIAEDLAVFDVISGGRLDLGIGTGSSYTEYRSFGIPIPERVGRSWEAIQFIERCFTETETFSHQGKYFSFPDVTFTTKPVQKKVPIWWGGMGPQNLARAAKAGYHSQANYSPAYDEHLRENGRNPDDFNVAPMKLVCIADTEEEAWKAAGDGILRRLNFYRTRTGLDGQPQTMGALTLDDVRSMGGSKVHAPVVGTPAQVREAFKRLAEGEQGRVTHVAIDFHMPGMDPADVERSMRMFAKDVMPVLNREPVPA